MDAHEKSQIELDSSFKSFLDPVYALDVRGTFSDVNDIFCDILDLNKTEIIGKSIGEVDFLSEESKNKAQENFNKSLAGEKIQPYLLEFLNKDGERVFLETNTNPFIKDGKVIGVIGVTCHISDRDTIQTKQLESKVRFRLLSESLPIGVFLADKDGTCYYMNTAWKEIFGLPLKKTHTKSWDLWIHPDDRDTVWKEWSKARDKLITYSKEFRIFTAKREIKWVRFRSSPMISDMGVSYPGTIEDITDRKNVEKALRQSESKYRVLFETSGTAMIIIEDDTTISLANTEFEHISGYSKDEVENKKSWTEFIVGSNLEQIKIYHRLRRRDPSSVPSNYESKFKDKHGNVKDVFITVEMIPGTKKSVTSLVDITEHIAMEKRLEQSFKELQQVDQMKSEFISMVSHEFRTPLAIIQGSVEFLQKHSNLAKADQEPLCTIIDESVHLNKIINILLQVSRIQAGKMILNKTKFNLSNLMRALYTEWKSVCKKDHKYLLKSESDIQITADETLIRTVVTNLLSNAHKYTQDGGTIETTLTEDNEQIQFAIKDNGVGISKEDQKHLFSLFYLADTGLTREADRMGVGLYTAKNVVELHDGKMWIVSEKDKGSTFYFTLPKT